jgi:tetratricopeptide (TPR) repeat protein
MAPQPRHQQFETGGLEDAFEFEPSNQAAQQMSHDQLEDPIIVDAPQRWTANGDAVDDLNHGQSTGEEDLPFDPDEARAFDMGVPKGETAQQYVSGFDDTELPNAPVHPTPTHASVDTASYEDASEDPLGVSGSYDPYGTEAVQTPPYDPTASHVVGAMPDLDDLAPAPAPAGRPETNVEDDLDEAEFYAGQGMYAEAMDVLRAVLDRYPNHRLVNAKMREIEALAQGGVPVDVEVDVDGHPAQNYSQGTEALDLDEIEEVSADDFEELSQDGEHGSPAKKKRGPTVMLEKPIDESDADTHYDLGLAYKEMGLYDEAMKAFEKALRAPGREVQCRLMMGMCQREMGNSSEAIHQFKQALHAEPKERERQSLYYEIGQTYESIGDDGEALYYFEMVTKRDPSFADAGQRAEALRARGAGRNTRRHDDDDI